MGASTARRIRGKSGCCLLFVKNYHPSAKYHQVPFPHSCFNSLYLASLSAHKCSLFQPTSLCLVPSFNHVRNDFYTNPGGPRNSRGVKFISLDVNKHFRKRCSLMNRGLHEASPICKSFAICTFPKLPSSGASAKSHLYKLTIKPVDNATCRASSEFFYNHFEYKSTCLQYIDFPTCPSNRFGALASLQSSG